MTRAFSWQLWLESMDGTTVIPLTHQDSRGQVLLQPGFLGLGSPPVDVAVGATPGVPGGFVEDITVMPRDVVLPLKIWGRTDDHKWSAVHALRQLTYPARGMTRTGSFRLVCHSNAGIRELVLTYKSGLEGDMHGRVAPERVVLSAVAVDPIVRDRTDTVLPFPLIPGGPFLSRAGTQYPWGTRRLSASTIGGLGMQVTIASEVEEYPDILLDGPAPDGAHIKANSGLDLTIRGGVLEGQTLHIVTDPRARSARLDTAKAWSMIGRPSALLPMSPGLNVLDVTVPGASSTTMLRLSYRAGHLAMWEGA